MRQEPGGGGAPRPSTVPPGTAATGPAARRALAALAELRARLLWRRLRGRGGVPEIVARVTLFAVALPAGVAFAAFAGAASFRAVRAGHGLLATVPVTALFFGVWQTWTVVSLSLSDREALDLGRFLVYPLRPSRVFGYGLLVSVVSDPFAVFWCLVLAGAFGGAALARPGPWLVLLATAHVLFAAATVALVALLQEAFARLLRRRAARALAIAAVYTALVGLIAWAGPGAAGGPRRALEALRAVRTVRWVMFPAALADEAVRALYAGAALAALPWLAALALGAAAAAGLAFRLALAQARSGGEAAGARGAAAGEGWRLPGRLAPLLEKEGKYLLRHPLTGILALVVPVLAAFVAWKAVPLIPEEAGEVVRSLPLFGFALYAHLATQVFWLNAFGWDRGGARLWFLAPIAPVDALVAKNVAVYAVSLGVFAASAAALAAGGGPPPAWALAGALALHAGIAPWFLAAGNAVSLLNPRAGSYSVQRGGRLSPISALAGMAIVSAGGALFGFPVLLAIRLEEPWLLAGAWLALGLAGAALYRTLLPRMARLVASRREPLLEAITGDEEG